MIVLIILGVSLGSYRVSSPLLAQDIPTPDTETERLDLRTRNAKVFQNANGSGYALVYSYPIHFQMPNGLWVEYDNQLIQDTSQGYWKNRTGDLKITFEPQLVSLATTDAPRVADLQPNPAMPVVATMGQLTWGFHPLDSLPSEGQVDGVTLLYPQVYPGVDLRYTMNSGMLKEDLIFNSLPAQETFSFLLHAGGRVLTLVEGYIVDLECQDSCITILPPYLQDAVGEQSSALNIKLEQLANGYYLLKYEPDSAWLHSPERQFPVILDPTVIAGSAYSTYTQEGFPTVSRCNVNAFVAVGYDPGNVGQKRTRGYFHLSLPNLPVGSSVTTAYFKAYQYYATYSSGYTAKIYRVTTDWANSATCGPGKEIWTWNNPPAIDWNTVRGTASLSTSTGWKSWTITGLVQLWYSGTANRGLVIVADPETARGSYFCSSIASASGQCGVSNPQNYQPYGEITYSIIAPAAPSNLTATGVSPSQINLSWQDNSNTEEGFKIERSPTGTSDWSQIATVGINVTTYQNTSLVCGTRYYYRVRSYNGGGNSSYTSTASAITAPCTPVLNTIANSDSNGSYNVSWGSATGASGYTLQEATNSGFTDATTAYSGSGTSTSLTERAPGTYYYRVKASNASGDSAWSNTQSVTVIAPPAVPTLNAISNTDGDGGYTVSWSSASSATSYTLQEASSNTFSDAITVYSGSGTSTSISDRSPSTYFYRVRASNVIGTSAWSNVRAVDVVALPTSPVLYSIDNLDGDGSFEISWSSITVAAGYTLQEATNSTFTAATTAYSGSNTSASLSGRARGTYFYRVLASNVRGNSTWSNVQSVVAWPARVYLPLTLRDYLIYFDNPFEMEPNNNWSSANGPLISGSEYYGYFNDEKDYFSIYLSRTATIHVDLELAQPPVQPVQLQLWQGIPQPWPAEPAARDTNWPFEATFEGSPGWYYIYINAGAGPYSTTDPYTLRVTYP